MFSSRNAQPAVPGVKNFGMAAPSKGHHGIRMFKGPSVSAFNPFSTASTRFDAFDVGYRSNQQQRQQSWQAPPSNIYAPPPPLYPTTVHNTQFAPRNNNNNMSSSRPQDVPRNSQAKNPSSYSIHPGISTDMFIYEASDVFSEYSASPALSTDSTATLQPPSPVQQAGRGRATPAPASRATTPAPTPAPSTTASSGPNQNGSQYTTNSFPSDSNVNGLPGLRHAQSALRGMFSESTGQSTVPSQVRSRARTLSTSSMNPNAPVDSDVEFDHLARMNTARNAGYSYYYPEPSSNKGPSNSRGPNSGSGPGGGQRSHRDSLMFYNGFQHTDQSPELDTVSASFAQTTLGEPLSNQVPSQQSGPSPNTNLQHQGGLAPPLHASMSNLSQSSVYSLLEAPSFQTESQSQLYPYPVNPIEQVDTTSTSTSVTLTYASVLTSSPEPHFTSSPTQEQIPSPSGSPTRSRSQHQSQSSPVSSHSSTSTSLIDFGSPVATPAEFLPPRPAYEQMATLIDLSPTSGQGRSTPHGGEARSSTITFPGESADPSMLSRRRSRSPPDVMRSGSAVPTTTADQRYDMRSGDQRSPGASPTTYSQQQQPSYSNIAPPPLPPVVFPPTTPAPLQSSASSPQQQQPPTRIRKDSLSLGMTSRSSRSHPNQTTSYPISTTDAMNFGTNGERPSGQSSAAVPSRFPSSIPEPQRRHSDGDNPLLTDATRRNAVPFQSEFVPVVSTASTSRNRDGQTRGVDSNTSPNQRPEPPRRRSEAEAALYTRISGVSMQATAAGIRSVRWNEELICPSPIWPSQKRKGWFNRRGDQLWTNSGSFRSPASGEEYPLDLNDYPEYGQGWMNEEGVRIDMAHRLIPKAPLRSALKKKEFKNAPGVTPTGR